MKVKLDDNEIVCMSQEDKKICSHVYLWAEVESEVQRRIEFIFKEIKNRCLSQLRSDWEQKLIDRGHEMLPVRLEKFAELVFAQFDYRDKAQRDQELVNAKRVQDQSNVTVM